MRTLLAAAALAAAMPLAAHAADYTQLQTARSKVGFSFTQMGVTLDGHFERFDGELRFDPAAPESARAVVEVELASIRTGMPDADDEVAGRSWFNIGEFPRARFESSSVKALGGERFEVSGALTIKGRSLPVVVPASFAVRDGVGVFEGEFVIRRGDFAVGEGAWAHFDVVANEVRVRYQISATQ